VVAWSFTAPESIDRLRLGDTPVLRLANPLSEEQSVMRPHLLPGLLDAARHNAAHGRPGVALFESAHVYRPAGPLEALDGSPGGTQPAEERHHLGVVVTELAPGTWRRPPAPGDFHAVRALLEGLLDPLGIGWGFEPGSEEPFLHPGRAATVVTEKGEVGWIGELHPGVARAWDLEVAGVFEVDADALAALVPATVAYRDVPAFPAALQDLAVVVADDVPAAAVERAVREGGGELLESVRLFDLYTGEQVGPGRKSLALRLEFRAPDRTLTDQEAAAARERIERAIEGLGGSLRG
jgi:phenylalanyl-tRNA synthetase beta chain